MNRKTLNVDIIYTVLSPGHLIPYTRQGGVGFLQNKTEIFAYRGTSASQTLPVHTVVDAV
jgi:hypothetical protein